MSTDETPPPPAEQASGEHVAVLEEMRNRVWEQGDHHARKNQDAAANRCAAQFNALGQAIAALSQRPVVTDAAIDRALAAWFALPSQTSDQSRMRAALTAALAPQQPEKGEG